MTQRADVAVVITCYNQSATIGDAIESVFRQTVSPRQILVVDDGSTDESARVIEALVHERTEATVVRQRNAGVVSARNRGLAEVDSLWVVFLDGDDRLCPTFVELTAAEAQRSEPTIVYSDLTFFGAETGRYRPPEWDPWLLRLMPYIPNPSLYRAAAVRAAGGYSDAMSDGLEDWDLHLALLERGAFGVHIPEALVEYRRGGAHSRDAVSRGVQTEQRVRVRRRHRSLYPILLPSTLRPTGGLARAASRAVTPVAVRVLQIRQRRRSRRRPKT